MGLSKKKIIIAIPARLESARLPNKVLKDINGKPMLLRVLDKCRESKVESQIVVCTDSEEIKKSLLYGSCEEKIEIVYNDGTRVFRSKKSFLKINQ